MKIQTTFKNLFTCATLLCLTAPTAYAEGEKILSCTGERQEAYDPVNTFGPKINIEVLQTPEKEDYRWFLKIAGNTNFEGGTNGPINEDGTTVAPNGDDGVIMYHAPGQGISIRKVNGQLQGVFEYVQAREVPPLWEHYPVKYTLNCQISQTKIDQREANIYNSTSELADSAVMLEKPWLNGVGIAVSDTLMALGVQLFVQDENQKNAFVEEFGKRGLVIKKEADSLFYKYKNMSGKVLEVPMLVEITGDIEPIP